jgi:multidrug transporter EmrE-like cation transporter
MISKYWVALLVAIISNVIANVAFKKAMIRTQLDGGVGGFSKLSGEPWIWLGVMCAGALLGCYLYALKGIDLSIAYPVVTGLAMLGIALAGTVFLSEAMSASKLIAMALIVIGVVMLRYSG